MHTPKIRKPYVLLLGAVTDKEDAKTAFGLRDWRRADCIGQLRMAGCKVDLGLPDLDPFEAARQGAGSLVIGVAPMGGRIAEEWLTALCDALVAGLDIVSGLHTRLRDIPALLDLARQHRRSLHDLRHSDTVFSPANGLRRTGKRLLTVGTDCALGKKYAALALTAALCKAGYDAKFRATGQTGILIAGEGIAVDAVVADFLAGAVEHLSPAAAPEHWDVIEGQGSILHPAYACVSLGLLHGSQPDAIVVCHDPTRRTLSGLPQFPLPRPEEIVEVTLRLGRVTNPDIRCVGVSLNTAPLRERDRARVISEHEDRLGVPCFDPMRGGVERVVASLARI